jgi:hypothetical protein
MFSEHLTMIPGWDNRAHRERPGGRPGAVADITATDRHPAEILSCPDRRRGRDIACRPAAP